MDYFLEASLAAILSGLITGIVSVVVAKFQTSSRRHRSEDLKHDIEIYKELKDLQELDAKSIKSLRESIQERCLRSPKWADTSANTILFTMLISLLFLMGYLTLKNSVLTDEQRSAVVIASLLFIIALVIGVLIAGFRSIRDDISSFISGKIAWEKLRGSALVIAVFTIYLTGIFSGILLVVLRS